MSACVQGWIWGHIPPTPTDIRHTSSITKFQYCYSTVGLELLSNCMTLVALPLESGRDITDVVNELAALSRVHSMRSSSMFNER